jgi:pimeloyl-ACP methyl ester carboxylesterase
MTRVERTVTSADGTRIGYYLIGDGPRPWVMPPAMGAPLISFRRLFEYFASDYTIVTWDQRGFYRSQAPRDPEAMKVDDHVADMHAVVEAEKLDHFVLGGWSMAVQLSLEYHHRRPGDVRALVLMNGPYERAIAGIAPFRTAEALALGALHVMRAAGAILNPLSRRVLGARGMSRTLHRMGIVAENPEFFEEVLAEFSTVDWRRYLTMARYLHEHSAAAYLKDIHVPTLITTGTRDLLTPMRIAQDMHAQIVGSELLVVPGATHYIVAEYPELLATRIRAFLDHALRA